MQYPIFNWLKKFNMIFFFHFVLRISISVFLLCSWVLTVAIVNSVAASNISDVIKRPVHQVVAVSYGTWNGEPCHLLSCLNLWNVTFTFYTFYTRFLSMFLVRLTSHIILNVNPAMAKSTSPRLRIPLLRRKAWSVIMVRAFLIAEDGSVMRAT